MLDAGTIATEMLYFLVGSRDLDGGLMCTASHNPSDYTGAKLVRRGALALSGDAMIEGRTASASAARIFVPRRGVAREENAIATSRAPGLKSHRVCRDPKDQ